MVVVAIKGLVLLEMVVLVVLVVAVVITTILEQTAGRVIPHQRLQVRGIMAETR
jgi:hypothetical protein